MYFGYRYGVGEEALFGAVASLMGIPSFLIQVAVYVFSALALYTIAKRRGLSNPWLSWIPVANVWILGSIADQYRYVARGEVRSKRKVLLTLKIISAALTAVMVQLQKDFGTAAMNTVCHKTVAGNHIGVKSVN